MLVVASIVSAAAVGVALVIFSVWVVSATAPIRNDSDTTGPADATSPDLASRARPRQLQGVTASHVDKVFGKQTPDAALLQRMVDDPDIVLQGWALVLDSPTQYETRSGIRGPTLDIKSGKNMYEFLGTLSSAAKRNGGKELTDAWKKHVAEGMSALLDEDGLLCSVSSTEGQRMRWTMGYQFHLIRKRYGILNHGGVNAIKVTWPGGSDGAGSKLARYILTDPYVFIKPASVGDQIRTLPVDAAWMTGAVGRGFQGGVSATRGNFLVGLFQAWHHLTPSLHGAWDGLTTLNELYSANGSSVFELVPLESRSTIGAAMRALIDLVQSGRSDQSGYGSAAQAEWRSACAKEIGRAGVMAIAAW